MSAGDGRRHARCDRQRIGQSSRTPRSRSRPIRRASRPAASAAIARPASTGSRSACSRSTMRQLRALGRLHTVGRSRGGDRRRARTFERFSFDLIYARPGQTRRRLARRTRRRRSPSPASIFRSTSSPSSRARPSPRWTRAASSSFPMATRRSALYEMTQEMTERAGLPAYEISNHAAPGEESRHNLLYWRYGEYAGHRPGRPRPGHRRRRSPGHQHGAPVRSAGSAPSRAGPRHRRGCRARAAPRKPTRRC